MAHTSPARPRAMLLALSAGQTCAPRPAAAAAALPLRRRLLLAARRGRVCAPRCTGGAPTPRPGATTRSPARSKCSPLLESTLLSPGRNEPAADEWKAVPDIWRTAAEKYPESVALVDPYHDPPTELTYKQLEQQILDFSHGLRAVGVSPDEKLALFADNSCRWLVADQGIMATGAINVVRGTKSSDEELFQIYSHSERLNKKKNTVITELKDRSRLRQCQTEVKARSGFHQWQTEKDRLMLVRKHSTPKIISNVSLALCNINVNTSN